MGQRSLRATPQGIQDIKKALKKKKGGQTYLAGAVGCSRQTIWSLLQGNPTDCDVFMEVCTQLGLNWEKVAEPELPEPEQNDSQDIDALVQEVRSHCCEAILDSYSKIRLLDDTRIDVDLLYVDVYVLEKLSSKRYASKSGMLEGVKQREDYERLTLGQRQERLPGQEIVQQFPRLMVLGKPGSGKTTFLRHLAVDCINGKVFCDRIPVLIELRSIKEGNSFNLLKLIHGEFGLAQQEQTQQLLNQGKAFILLDGLDEVPSQLRQSVRDQIYEFAKEYRKNRFVLTCRTQTIEYIADHFEPIEVANFDSQQVKIFARHWFTATPETSGVAEGWTSRFVGKLEENKQIRELAVTPILLTLTCLLFTAEQNLPTKRSELYEKGSNLLLQHWDKFREIPRDYQRLSVSDKQKLLSYLAFRKFEQPDNFILFEQDEIQGYIAGHLGISVEESEALLRAIENYYGLLIERAKGIWSFSHLTFQEYFAAKHIVNSPTPKAEIQRLVTHINEPRWREVFLLVVELLPSADDLLRLMKKRIDALVAADNKLQELLTWLNKKSLSVKVSYKPAAVRAFYFEFACPRMIILDKNPRLIFAHQDYVDKVIVDHTDYLVQALDHTLAAVRKDNVLACDLTVDRALDRSFTLAISRIQNARKDSNTDHALLCKLFSSIAYDLDCTIAQTIELACARVLKPELKRSLQKLKGQLPVLEKDDTTRRQWWEDNGQNWAKKLNTAMSKYCNIGQNWQLSKQQDKLLHQYYYGNELLVNCLNSSCYVNRDVRQEIEETLLLPIAEIEKIKKMKYKS